MFDGKKFGEEIVAVVKSYLRRETRAIDARLDALEKRMDDLHAVRRIDDLERRVDGGDASGARPRVKVKATGVPA